MEGFVNQTINEIHWRFFKMTKGDVNMAGMLDGSPDMTFIHVPWCRCPQCPLYDDEAFKLAKKKRSPYHGQGKNF